MGGHTLSVAKSRVVGRIPKTEHIPLKETERYLKSHNKKMKFLETAKRKEITLPFAGKTFRFDTPLECAEKVEKLQSLGYNVPAGVIESLKESQDELDMSQSADINKKGI
jgi:hypothetical protein